MCLLFLCQPFLCVKADKLHTAKCMVHVLLQTLNLPATLTLCTAHCKQAVQWCLCSYCSTQRDDETLTRFHPRKVVDSTQGLAKQQLQALLTHVWCNRHNIKQHIWSAVASMPVTSMLCTGAGKLRSADCVAEGRVQVVVINKKDFMDLDNPLLAWMLDSDAVTTVLRVCASCTQL